VRCGAAGAGSPAGTSSWPRGNRVTGISSPLVSSRGAAVVVDTRGWDTSKPGRGSGSYRSGRVGRSVTSGAGWGIRSAALGAKSGFHCGASGAMTMPPT